MAGLGATLAKLVQRNAAVAAKAAASGAPDFSDRLAEFGDAAINPGNLRARAFVPADLPPRSALVVVLHGCTQTASGYDRGSGWSQLAAEQGFAVLYPEQERSNNPNLCFNWFSPVDQQRGSGEAESIRRMIAAMVEAHGIDERRIFITGLSAGGAMASIMLANYPEVFAGGAVIAGLPFGNAASVADALARMRGDGYPAPAALVAQVRNAAKHDGPWPVVSVWQGKADTVVDPSNADRIAGQWRGVHGVAGQIPETDRIDGSNRQRWRDANGRIVVETWLIDGMGHGTPLATRGSDACGISGPHMLEAGISSTRHIARGWGLLPVGEVARVQAPAARVQAPAARASAPEANAAQRPASNAVGSVIEDALRAAGLMR